MGIVEDIAKLRDARDKTAKVFENEVMDETFDNGLLQILCNAVSSLEVAIETLKKRLP